MNHPIAKHRLLMVVVAGMIWATYVSATIAEVAPKEKVATNAAGGESLVVIDEATHSHSLSHDDIRQLVQQKVKGKTHAGVAEFRGPSLVDVLKSVGVEFGDELKGKRASTVAICDAPDGYRVVVSLLEIDPATTDQLALVADVRDGQPLDAKQGPFRLVIPSDKREIRWIRNLRTIRVVNLKDLPLGQPTDKKSAKAFSTNK